MGEGRRRKRYCSLVFCLLILLCPPRIGAQSFGDGAMYAEQGASFSAVRFFSNIISDINTITHNLNIASSLIESQPDSAERLVIAIYRDSKAIHYYPGMVSAMGNMARMQQNQGNFDSALVLYQKAAPLALRCGPKCLLLYKIYLNMAVAYGSKGNYEQELNYYYKSLNVVKTYRLKISNRDSALLFHNITYTWCKLGETEKARESLALLKKTTQNKQDITSLLRYYCMVTSVDTQLGDSDKLAYYWKIVHLSYANNNTEVLIPVLNSICVHYTKNARLDSAKIYLNKAFDLLNQNPGTCTHDLLITYKSLAGILTAEKKYLQAEKILEQTYQQAKAMQFDDFILFMEPSMAEIYSITGKYNKAYEHQKHYTALQSNIMSLQKTQSVQNWNKSRMAEKDKQLLKNKLYITVQDGKLHRKNFWITTITLSSLLLLSAFMAFIFNYRSKQKLQQVAFAQLQQAREINQLKAQVRGEEQERNRIAVELHDGIASQLWAIKLNVDHLLQKQEGQASQQQNSHNDQQRNLHNVYRHLDEVTQDIRKTAHNLMPGLLLEVGLSSALATLCERTEKSTHLEVDFLEYGPMPKMDLDIQHSLYRMVQELIQNVLKHAQASLLLVQLSCVGTLLTITIEDNGNGFAAMEEKKEPVLKTRQKKTKALQGHYEADTPCGNDTTVYVDYKSGLGLKNIQKRVETFQGRFDLISAPGIGTTVYMEFDIQYLI